jgi:hypothetical protein
MKEHELMNKCPRWNSCNAPICPLDALMEKRLRLTGEDKCKLTKKVRLELGKSLKNKGLLPKELGGIKGYKNMDTDTQLKIAKIGSKNLKSLVI